MSEETKQKRSYIQLIKSGILNLLILSLVVVAGTTVGSYVPDVKQWYADIDLEEANLEVTQQYGNKVVLYGKDSCPYCLNGKALLSKMNVDWVYVDIEKDEQAKAEFEKLNESGVPVLFVGNDRIRGFLEKEWKEKVEAFDASK